MPSLPDHVWPWGKNNQNYTKCGVWSQGVEGRGGDSIHEWSTQSYVEWTGLAFLFFLSPGYQMGVRAKGEMVTWQVVGRPRIIKNCLETSSQPKKSHRFWSQRDFEFQVFEFVQLLGSYFTLLILNFLFCTMVLIISISLWKICLAEGGQVSSTVFGSIPMLSRLPAHACI